MTKPSRMVVIINASSGAHDKQEARQQLTDIFASSHVEAHISLAQSGEEISTLTSRAIRAGHHTIVAGGGDGTINAVASQLVGTHIRLGVLPLGTLNHFAKDLHIPLDLEAAARTIIAEHIVRVDVGEVNGRVFLNNSSLGLYPDIVRGRERQQQRLGRGKWQAFFWAALTALRRYPFLNIRLSADGQQLIRRTPFVFIGNNQYEMESFNIGGRACLDAGHLSLYVVHNAGRLRLLQLSLNALFSRLHTTKDFSALCVGEVWIETHRKRLRVAVDGEVTVMQSPLHYRVRPQALHVIVPSDNQRQSATKNNDGE